MTEAVEKLVGLAQRGDEEARRALLMRFEPLLRAAARRVAGKHPPAGLSVADLWEEACLAFLELLAEYQPRGCGSFGVYLSKKVPWRLANRVRIEREYEAMTTAWPDEDDDERPDQAETMEEGILDEVCVAQALDQLPPQQRKVLRRIYWLAESTDEVAAALGLTPREVNRLRRRAEEKLRGVLKER